MRERWSIDAGAEGSGARTPWNEQTVPTAGPVSPAPPGPDDGGPQAGDGVVGFMGMRWEGPETVHLTIRPELVNAGGMLSGVVTYAMVDYGMGSALWVHTTEHEHVATINIAINYVQAASRGEIVCRTSLDRRNRRSAVLRSEVHHEDGRLLVTAIGSYAIFAARGGPHQAWS